MLNLKGFHVRVLLARFALVLVATTSYSAAQALQSHGYFRTGLGWSRDGTSQTCFRAPGTEGHSGKHRLGNECETYIEWSVSEEYPTPKGKFRSHLRLSIETRGHRDFEDTRIRFDPDAQALGPSPAYFALREIFAEAIEVQNWPFTLWIGKRFYQRIDLHMLDAFIFNNTGPGVGIEAIPAPLAGKLHLAITRNVMYPSDVDRGAQSNFDLRWSDIPLLTGGQLMTYLILGQSSGFGHLSGQENWESVEGYQTGFFHRQNLATDLNMLLALQFGKGLYGAISSWHHSAIDQFGAWDSTVIPKGDTIARDHRMESWSLRLIDQVVLHSKGDHSFEGILMYHHSDFGGAPRSDEDATPMDPKIETTWGLRHLWQFAPHLSLATEFGQTEVQNVRLNNPDQGLIFPTVQLNKITFAPQVSPDMGFWTRPNLRLFATYAHWNDAAVGSSIGGQVYAQDRQGWSIGAQVESWW